MQKIDFCSCPPVGICAIERGRRPLPIEVTRRTRMWRARSWPFTPSLPRTSTRWPATTIRRRARTSDALRGLFARLEARIAYWLRYRATVAELGDLTDRQLADIGISRGNIAAVARTAARA